MHERHDGLMKTYARIHTHEYILNHGKLVVDAAHVTRRSGNPTSCNVRSFL